MADSDAPIRLYISSVASNRALRKKQQKMISILESKRIQFETVDVAASEDDKNRMRELCSDETALPPRIFKGDTYLGDYEAFDEAVEEGNIQGFLRLS